MKLVELLVKELEEWPEGVTYFVQDGDREVKAGSGSELKEPTDSCVWIRRITLDNYNFYSGLCTDWKTSIVTKDIYTKHKEDTQMKQICVNVSDLTIEEKQRVNKALAKIKNIMPCPPMFWGCPMDWESVVIMFVTSYDGGKVGFDCCANRSPTHTTQQVLEMAGMAEQGHVHAESMAQYAEDAKTHSEPWVLWQIKDKYKDDVWFYCQRHPIWATHLEYRRKPKTHIVNGVEIPVFEFTPKVGGTYYTANVGLPEFFEQGYREAEDCTFTQRMIERGLIYPYTEEGKQAAILHSKAMLGIAYLSNAHHTHN